MLMRRRSGLGSLIPGAEFEAEAGGITPEMVPLTAIAVNPYQPRRVFEPEALEELAESIRRHGILQPLTVRTREGGYELIAGERRLQASRKVGLTSVPVIIRECTDEEMLALALVENLQREDLNPIESARSYQRLIEEFGLTQAEVAAHVGKSRSAVANTIRLLDLPELILQAVELGTVSEGHARTLLAVDTPERQAELFRETVEQGLTVRELEARVRPSLQKLERRKTKKGGKLDANLHQLESDFQLAFGTKVRFRPGSTHRKGVIEIEYYAPEDLERIYETIKP